MGWLIPRLLAAVLAVLLGAVIGRGLGTIAEWPALGAVLGAVGGALLHAFVDALRGHRFMDWLRGQHEGPAPRDAGFWGELGYRVERAVRGLEKRIEAEPALLDQYLPAIEAF